MYAEVAVNAPVRSTFHYHIPPELDGQIAPGHLVRVSFGTAQQPGIVIALHPTSPIELTKPVIEKLDPYPVVTQDQLKVAQWMSEQYLAPLGACLWLMMPPGITGKSDKLVKIADTTLTPDDGSQQTVVAFLQKYGPRQLSYIKSKLRQVAVQKTVETMVKAGILETEGVLSPPTVKEKQQRIVSLAIAHHEVRDVARSLRGSKQKRILTFLLDEGGTVYASLLYTETGASFADVRKLEARGLVIVGEERIWRDSMADRYYVPTSALRLTPEQERVSDRIKNAIDDYRAKLMPLEEKAFAFLLHGVTGSGKTEIYLRAIEHTLAQGRQAIFLVPEIALTPQTIKRVASRFPDRVAVVHGSLNYGERFDTWLRARSGKIDVIVGTRSALYTPLPKLGLIILDEEHDHSYKQTPPTPQPYYHARDVAEQVMRQVDGVLILGSATPDVETYYRSQTGEITYLHLSNRIMGHRERIAEQAHDERITTRYHPMLEDAMTIDLPPVRVVDMRDELKAGNRSIFSRDLKVALDQVLANKEQAILFLNRRGQATYVFCRDCGYVVVCKRCEMPMTYHRSGEAMRCHHCGFEMQSPKVCPKCSSDRIKFFGAGTEHIEAELKKLFPDARVLRWDADTATRPDMHELILRQFTHREADIMVGTQMIAKGLDLPLVTLVGVVSADLGLALPDFRAGERVFQLLTQVAGRAGRGLLGGQVVLQTYQPKNYAVAAASQHDYQTFYAQEIGYRREMAYPPFRHLARILFQDTHPIRVQQEAERAAKRLQKQIDRHKLTSVEIIGPAPCFFRRIDRHYRWHLLVRGPNPTGAFDDFDIPSGWQVDIDPVDVL